MVTSEERVGVVNRYLRVLLAMEQKEVCCGKPFYKARGWELRPREIHYQGQPEELPVHRGEIYIA
jgi:hypothetical protein